MSGKSKSQTLFRRARELILGGAQTISKQPQRFDAECFPAYADRAAGCRLWDLDGNEFVDFVMALGPIVLGYAPGSPGRGPSPPPPPPCHRRRGPSVSSSCSSAC